MDENIISLIKDGDATRFQGVEAPSIVDIAKAKPKFEGTVKKKRRRGKYKRKVMKPFVKLPWQDRWKRDKPKRNNRFRKGVLAETHAPFNNNQFLMEIHKPEPENNFLMGTPSARTRDSSFSIDSEDNYFYSLPEDEEEYLTKEFSSVYEDAQCERLSNMSKNELIQEYLLLEVKYDNLVKRTERLKNKPIDEDTQESDKETSATDMDSMIAESGDTSVESSITEDPRYLELLQRMKEKEEQIRELQVTNEKLRLENEHLHKQSPISSSEDSESDSSSSSDSNTSSSSNVSDQPTAVIVENSMNNVDNHIIISNGQNHDVNETATPMVNGFHSPNQ